MKSMKIALLVMGVIAAVLAPGPAAAGKKSATLPVTDNTIGGPAEFTYTGTTASLWRTFGSATADICVTMLNESRGSAAQILMLQVGQFDVPPGETRTFCSTGEVFFRAICDPGSVCTVQWRVDLM